MDKKVPILIIIFNRPEKVKRLIKSLSALEPENIYIAADGPRDNVEEDKKSCEEARRLAINIPWKCNVETRFVDKNYGCRYGVTNAIDWFFDNVNEGIILEDDCIPHPSFFPFCTTLLDKYRNNEEIMHISGNNFQNGIKRTNASYYFSKYTHSWGWATWRRAWKSYHTSLASFDEYDKWGEIQKVTISPQARKFWIKNFRFTIKRNDSWDSLWQYSVWNNNGLAILPEMNLVTNIGFDNEATHTKNISNLATMPTQNILPIVHPTKIEQQREADDYTFEKIYRQNYVNLIKRHVLDFCKNLFK